MFTHTHTHTHAHVHTKFTLKQELTFVVTTPAITDALSLPFSLVDHARGKREGTSGVSETKDAYNRQWTTAPRHFRVAGRGYRSNQSTS